VQGPFTVPVTNNGNWSTTGLGIASAAASGPLADGSYRVQAVLNANGFVIGPDAQATLTSSPVTGSFVTGGGFINPDSTANSPDTTHNGNFGITVKFNKSGSSLQGNAIYVYRVWMNVVTGALCPTTGGSNCRDVDVVVKSNNLSALSVNMPTPSGTPCAPTTPCTAAITGKFSVQYNDAMTGVQYTQFGFGNGTFQVNVTDRGNGPGVDMFAEAMHNPDGTIFHLSTAPFSTGTGSATQVLLGGGNITVHP
jgi:hypothetical protein